MKFAEGNHTILSSNSMNFKCVYLHGEMWFMGGWMMLRRFGVRLEKAFHLQYETLPTHHSTISTELKQQQTLETMWLYIHVSSHLLFVFA